MNTGTHKPYRKPNDETLYIHAKSNHPTNILKQLPISIETRLSNLSSNSEIFNEASKHYQQVLNQSGYEYELQYRENQLKNNERNHKQKNRKRNIIWFNPPFSKNVTTNIGKYFLQLIQTHFPNNNKYHKIFNKNNLKLSYSCMNNMRSIINAHNKEILTEKKTPKTNCNCINKSDCPLNNQCQTASIIYKAKVTSNQPNYFYKVYYGTSEGTFKLRYANHKKSFNHEIYRTDTELSKEYWRLKELNAEPQIEFKILKKCPPTRRTGTCFLCLNEKLFILEHKGNNLLNKRNELISKCRHKNKFKLANHKT